MNARSTGLWWDLRGLLMKWLAELSGEVQGSGGTRVPQTPVPQELGSWSPARVFVSVLPDPSGR